MELTCALIFAWMDWSADAIASCTSDFRSLSVVDKLDSAALTASTAEPARLPILLGMPVRIVTVSWLPMSSAKLPFR